MITHPFASRREDFESQCRVDKYVDVREIINPTNILKEIDDKNQLDPDTRKKEKTFFQSARREDDQNSKRIHNLHLNKTKKVSKRKTRIDAEQNRKDKGILIRKK